MKIKLNQINKLPNESGIYAVFDKDDKVLYVGKSNSLNHRWKNHHLMNGLKEQYPDCYIQYILLDKDGLIFYEKEFIAMWKPMLNGRVKNFKKYYFDNHNGKFSHSQFTIFKYLSDNIDKECKKQYLTRSQFMNKILKFYFEKEI